MEQTVTRRASWASMLTCFKPFLVLSSCSAFGPQDCQ